MGIMQAIEATLRQRAMQEQQQGQGEEQETKRCAKCLRSLPITEFWRVGSHAGERSKLRTHCRRCHSKAARALNNFWGTFTPNRWRIEGDTAFIELTNRNDVTIAEAKIDAADLERVLAAGRWSLSKSKRTNYCDRQWRENGQRKSQALQRFLLDAPADLLVDHIDGDGLNDRKGNLRLVSKSGNAQNQVHRSSLPASGVPNVSWHARSQRWCVVIKLHGKSHFFGSFATVEEARPIAEAARRELHPFAPREGETETAGRGRGPPRGVTAPCAPATTPQQP